MTDELTNTRQLSYATRDALYRCIYLHDFNQREGLSWVGRVVLERAQREVADAIGLPRESV